ncbi:MAG: hypothetical protein AB4352_25635 [Hormoscilla sp.]
MSELIVKTNNPERVAEIIKGAIAKKLAMLEHNQQVARKKIEKFEHKYNVSSEKFIKEWAAEDLEGKDMEYVEWAGEYKLYLLAQEDLQILKSLDYVTK